jgi:hypothetical protein
MLRGAFSKSLRLYIKAPKAIVFFCHGLLDGFRLLAELIANDTADESDIVMENRSE